MSLITPGEGVGMHRPRDDSLLVRTGSARGAKGRRGEMGALKINQTGELAGVTGQTYSLPPPTLSWLVVRPAKRNHLAVAKTIVIPKYQ